MRKLLFCVIATVLALACISLSACNTKSHSISYQGELITQHLMDDFTPTKAKPGDTVVLRTGTIMDADLTFYANGVRLTNTHSDSDYWEYIFIMPDEDVVITYEMTDGFFAK